MDLVENQADSPPARTIVSQEESEIGTVASEGNAPPPSSIPPGIPVVDVPSYAQRFKASLRNLKKISNPTFLKDGTPVVQAPPEVLLKTSEIWKDHIVAQFHGTLPARDKIYSDLNPVWGKFGNITLHKTSDSSCLIYIPSVQTREWVLQVGYWQADHCAFSVFPWSADGNFDSLELKSAPTWAVLKNLPPQLYSLEGISVVASAIGEPLHTEKSKLDPYRFGDTKVKIEIILDHPPPETVVVRDTVGNSVKIAALYPSLPPKCCNCGKFGHLLNHCQKPLKKKRIKSNVQKNRKEKTKALVVATSTSIELMGEQDIAKVQPDMEAEVEVVVTKNTLEGTKSDIQEVSPALEQIEDTKGQQKRRNRSRSRARARARGRSASYIETATGPDEGSRVLLKPVVKVVSDPSVEDKEGASQPQITEADEDKDSPWITKNSKWARRAIRQEELWKANLTKTPTKNQSLLFTRGFASGKKI